MNSRFNVYLQKQIGDFLSANEKTLREFVEMAKATLEDRPVTLLVQGLEKYYRYRFEHFVHLRARLCNILRMRVQVVFINWGLVFLGSFLHSKPLNKLHMLYIRAILLLGKMNF